MAGRNIKTLVFVGTLVILMSACGASESKSANVPVTTTSTTLKSLAFSEGAPLPTAVSEVGVAATFNSLHVVGGYVGGKAHSTTHLVYEFQTKHWSLGVALPEPLDHVGVAAVGDAIYAMGGYGTAGRPTLSVYRLDENGWTKVSQLPDARAAAAIGVINGQIHLVGGRDLNGDTDRHDVYDPSTNTWTSAAPIPIARDHTAYAVVDGKLHVAGGRPNNMTDHEIYDPDTNSWSKAAPLPQGRSSFAGATLRGSFVVMGGEDAAEQSVFSTVFVYDPKTDTWHNGPALLTAMQGIGAATVDDTAYIPGGGPSGGGTEQSNQLQILR